MSATILAWFVWNPSRVCFYLPIIHHPVVWYGVLFACGFVVSYLYGRMLFLYEGISRKEIQADAIKNPEALQKLCEKNPRLFPSRGEHEVLPLLKKYVQLKRLPFSFFKAGIFSAQEFFTQAFDRFSSYMIWGVIIGARVGYILFYGWPTFKNNPIEIFKIWEGGLASHGACLGMIVALIIFVRKYKNKENTFSFLYLLDVLALVSGVMAFFIRLGNFVNQEIVGTVTQVPWAIIFLNPLNGELIQPRHPVQLYEAFFYLSLAVAMFFLWKKNRVKAGQGLFTGMLLVTLFSFRFFIEFVKEPQGIILSSNSPLEMGQILSIPFIGLGLVLILRARRQQFVKGKA